MKALCAVASVFSSSLLWAQLPVVFVCDPVCVCFCHFTYPTPIALKYIYTHVVGQDLLIFCYCWTPLYFSEHVGMGIPARQLTLNLGHPPEKKNEHQSY